MCVIQSLEFTGVTALETLTYVIVSSLVLSPHVSLIFRLFVSLFLFVCFALTVESHILGVPLKRELLPSPSAKP